MMSYAAPDNRCVVGLLINEIMETRGCPMSKGRLVDRSGKRRIRFSFKCSAEL